MPTIPSTHLAHNGIRRTSSSRTRRLVSSQRSRSISRVVIQPGSKIPLHLHQGTQLGYIQSGTLTYTVEAGRAKVMSGPGDAGKLVRWIKAGQTAKVKAGQWLIEQPSNHHRAANNGSKPVVILLSNLLLKNAKPSELLP